MTWVDLDALTSELESLQASSGSVVAHAPELAALVRRMPALVAELRAAREVINVTRPWHPKPHLLEDPCHICRALVAYDEAVGS